MNRNMLKLILAGVFATSFIACSHQNAYFEYQAIRSAGWNKDSALVFTFPVSETGMYNVYVNIRHTSEYQYQNFWFFIEKSTLSAQTTHANAVSTPTTPVHKDTIECYLADARGKWLGNGGGATYDMPVIVETKVKLDVATYQYQIKQGMRDDVLQGISNIGLRVERVSQ